MNKEFITITKEEFEEKCLPEKWDRVDSSDSMEYIYDVPTPNSKIDIRIFSTIDKRNNISRKIGADAIRIIYWDNVNDRPVGKGKKILRVEGTTTIHSRIQSRIKEFLSSANNQNIIDFDYVKFILENSSWATFAMDLLKQLNERKSLSDKQLAFVLGEVNPRGKNTFESLIKRKNPEKIEEFLNSNLEDENEEKKEIKNEKENEQKTEKIINIIKTEPINSIEKDKINDDIKLVSTEGYDYPFEYFNPVQSQVIPHADKDVNIIVEASTAAGKTVCAEIVMKHVLQKKKVIYTSPLKSLSNEKFEDWQKQFSECEITMLTGDTLYNDAQRKKQFAKANNSDIILTTTELIDSITRQHSEKTIFLEDIGLLVLDEFNLLASKERGHSCETALMRFTTINKKSRLMFLSATAPNSNEIKEWTTLLNKKETIHIKSNYRPTKLNINIIEHPVIKGQWNRPDYWKTEKAKIDFACQIVLHKPDEKFLVFVHSKGTGRSVIKALKEVGIDSRFHSADLELKERKEIENSFKDVDKGLRVLVSTSTTAYGINMPAKNVIITGVHRGISEVDLADILQMIGRSGRPKYDKEGYAFVLVPEGQKLLWEEKIKYPPPINSVLNEKATLAFHVLSEIQNKTITDDVSCFKWFKRSLAYMQESKLDTMMKFDESEAAILFSELMDMDMIKKSDYGLKTTNLGNVSASLYYSPYDVYSWYNNFKTKKELKENNDLLLAWAISNIPGNATFINKELKDIANEIMYKLSNIGVRCNPGCIPNIIATYNCLTGEEIGNGGIKAIQKNVVYDIERVTTAIKMIDLRYASWKLDYLDSLPIRIKYSIPEEMTPLVKIKKVGGTRAKKLWEAGYRTISDVAKAEPKNMNIFNPALAKTIINNAKMAMKGKSKH